MSMDIYETTAIRELNESLAAVNKFDLNALMLNQQGMLAPSQMKIVYRRVGGLGFFFLALIGGGIYQYIKFGFPENGIVTAIYIFIAGYLGYSVFIALRNASAKKVESMDGIGFSIYTTDTNRSTGRMTRTYYYEISNTRFMIYSEAAYHALINDLKYRVYYLPSSKALVNIEALQPPPEQRAKGYTL